MRDAGLVEFEEQVYRSPPGNSPLLQLPDDVFLTPMPKLEPAETHFWVIWPLPALKDWYKRPKHNMSELGCMSDADLAGLALQRLETLIAACVDFEIADKSNPRVTDSVMHRLKEIDRGKAGLMELISERLDYLAVRCLKRTKANGRFTFLTT
jgi:hypothetical protein